MGLTERKEREKHEMREMILAAAKRLFIREGFESVTIRRIADEIEYSPATVYLYFKDKDTILCALQETGFRELSKRLEMHSSIVHPVERLKASGKTYCDFALENREMYDLMFIMRAPMNALPSPEEWTVGRHSYELLQSTVQECVDGGYLHSTDAKLATFALWALMHGIVSIFIRERAPMIPVDQHSKIISKIMDFTLTNVVK